jgi:threonine/homoserine/homoserine lactone efflux protein
MGVALRDKMTGVVTYVDETVAEDGGLRRAFLQGWLTNVTNPRRRVNSSSA